MTSPDENGKLSNRPPEEGTAVTTPDTPSEDIRPLIIYGKCFDDVYRNPEKTIERVAELHDMKNAGRGMSILCPADTTNYDGYSEHVLNIFEEVLRARGRGELVPFPVYVADGTLKLIKNPTRILLELLRGDHIIQLHD